MQYKDYYAIMGLKRDASSEEVKRAYRKLARKYHPDVSKEPDAENRFKELGEAYEVLKDPEKRANYDQLGSQWRAGQEFHPPPHGTHAETFEFNGSDFSGTGQFSDFFEALFGRAGARTQSAYNTRARGFNQRGEDIHSKIMLTVAEAYHGAQRTIQFPITTFNAAGVPSTTTRTLKVTIPAGVLAGQHIRLSGQGSPGLGTGSNGDLYLEIDLEKHPWFQVNGADIYLNLPITPWEAALGATIPVPTLGGKVEVKIPAGSQTGQKLRLKGRGLPAKSPGDQYVLLQVWVPEAKTPAAQDYYRKMAETLPFNPRHYLEV